MEEIISKIKKYFNEMDSKKFKYNLFIIFTIGIILLIVANIFTEDKKPRDTNLETEKILDDTKNFHLDYVSILEEKLEEILNELKGVSNVKVMITLEDTIEKIPAINTTKNNETTNEVDSQGGTRETLREDTTIQIVTGNEGSLRVLKEVEPTVKGVIVIAEGAENLEVKEMLYDAVKTVLGVSGNRVEVYSSK